MNKRIILIVLFAACFGIFLIWKVPSGKERFSQAASVQLYSYVTSDAYTNEVIKLLKEGADPNFRPVWPSHNTTPLHVAAMNNAFQIGKLLVTAGATNGIKDAAGKTAFDLLVFGNRSEEDIVKWSVLLRETNRPVTIRDQILK